MPRKLSKAQRKLRRSHPRNKRTGRFITKRAYKARLRRQRQRRKPKAPTREVVREEVPVPSPVEGLKHYRVQITMYETPYTKSKEEEAPKDPRKVSTVVVEVWAKDRSDAIKKAIEHLRAKVANNEAAQVRNGISALLTLEECVVYGVEEIKEEKPFIKKYVWD